MAKKKTPEYPEGTHAIEKGLYVRKKWSMASYFVRVQKDGKRHDIGLGSVSMIDEDTARRRAMEIRVDVARGATPWIKEETKTPPPTFKDFFPDAFRRYVEASAWKGEDTAAARLSLVRRYAMPSLSSIRIDEITTETIVSVLSPVWKESVLKGDLLRRVLHAVFARAIADGHLKENPAVWTGSLEFHLPSRKRPPIQHCRAMSFEECRLLLPELMARTNPSARAIVMVMLTARRIREVVSARWSDLDLDAGVWTIPDAVMKVSRGAPRRVPLPRQLVGIMKSWPKTGEYVFASKRVEKIVPQVVLAALRRYVSGKPTVHGFRSTFIDWCAEHDVPIEVAEKCLDHESGSQVRRAYQRSDLFEQRREVLQRYADALFEE